PRRLARAPRDQVGCKPHRGPRREDVGAAGDVLLQHVVLRRASDQRRIASLTAARDVVHRDEHGGRGGDRHRRGYLGHRDAVEHVLDIPNGVDRHAQPADLPGGTRVVGVEPHLRGQVKGGRERCLSLFDQEAKPAVRLLTRAEAGVLADRPGTPPVHVAVDAARIRVAARLAQPRLQVAWDVLSGGERPVLAHSRRPCPSASAPTSTTIFPTCWFSFIIWWGTGHSSNGNTFESTGWILPSMISWFARLHS